MHRWLTIPLLAGLILLAMISPAPAWIDTSNGFWLDQQSDYPPPADPTSIAKYFSFVWAGGPGATGRGAMWRAGNPNIVGSTYGSSRSAPHHDRDLNFWQTNHPTWVLYRCDNTPAFQTSTTFSDQVTLDIGNPAVAAEYAARSTRNIAWDNSTLDNADSACGIRNPGFTQLYTGVYNSQRSVRADDPAYLQARINFMQAVTSTKHATNGALSIWNSLGAAGCMQDPTCENNVLSAMDGFLFEGGYTDGGNFDFQSGKDFPDFLRHAHIAQSLGHHVSLMGSATQVMPATRFRATVGQKQPPQQGDQQQPCSSERRAQHVDQAGTRKMAIPAMGSRIISVKRANVSLWLWPKTVALRTSSAPSLNTCCVSAFRSAESAEPWVSV